MQTHREAYSHLSRLEVAIITGETHAGRGLEYLGKHNKTVTEGCVSPSAPQVTPHADATKNRLDAGYLDVVRLFLKNFLALSGQIVNCYCAITAPAGDVMPYTT